MALVVSGRVELQWLLAGIGTLGICLGGAVGGLLIDRMGVKKVVGLALVAWCALVVLGALADPLAYVVLAPSRRTRCPA